jgi:hypothetical protein
MKLFNLLFSVILISFLFSSCDSDEPAPINQEELITTVEVTLTKVSTGDVRIYTFRDIDGDGGQDPSIDNIILDKNTNYTGSVRFLDESRSPIEDITVEVFEEATEHQLFYVVGADIDILYTDLDSDGNPLGLETAISVGDISEFNEGFKIILRHEPNKAASGVSDGDITNAGGETDVEVTFPIITQ